MKYFISYAQNYEDVMLHRALKDVQHGFYIDVGAQDPETDSVTRAFYERGWRGINIEPVQHWFERLQEQRPNDINLRVAVSDHAGELVLFESDASGLSTSDAHFAAHASSQGWALHEERVACVTLEQICEEHGVKTVHFLKVDCEGGEAAALRGMPLKHIRPWVVIVEATEPNSTKPTHQQWEHLLVGSDYEFVYFDGLNRYYVAAEHAELRDAFLLPPNVFDWFKTAAEERWQRQAEHWSAENDRREVALGQSRELIGNLQAQLSGLKAEIGRLQSEVELHIERLASERQQFQIGTQLHLQAMHALEEEIGRLQQEYRDNAAERNGLRAALEEIRSSHSWRMTRPLRAVGRGVSTMGRLLNYGTTSVLRPAMHGLRPMLRRLVHQPAARRFVLVLVGGRESALARHMRVFLFGPLHIATPYRIALIDGELDSSVYSYRERVALAALQRAIPSITDNEE